MGRLSTAKDYVTEQDVIRIINWFCRAVAFDASIKIGTQRGLLN
jgi:hypothetical protein